MQNNGYANETFLSSNEIKAEIKRLRKELQRREERVTLFPKEKRKQRRLKNNNNNKKQMKYMTVGDFLKIKSDILMNIL